jgi:hypothetical protein
MGVAAVGQAQSAGRAASFDEPGRSAPPPLRSMMDSQPCGHACAISSARCCRCASQVTQCPPCREMSRGHSNYVVEDEEADLAPGAPIAFFCHACNILQIIVPPHTVCPTCGSAFVERHVTLPSLPPPAPPPPPPQLPPPLPPQPSFLDNWTKNERHLAATGTSRGASAVFGFLGAVVETAFQDSPPHSPPRAAAAAAANSILASVVAAAPCGHPCWRLASRAGPCCICAPNHGGTSICDTCQQYTSEMHVPPGSAPCRPTAFVPACGPIESAPLECPPTVDTPGDAFEEWDLLDDVLPPGRRRSAAARK